MKQIYLDHSATTPLDKEAGKAMLPFLSENFGNASSLHSFGIKAKEALENSRSAIAKKINSSSEEIIFTSGGSESDNLAIKGTAFALKEKGNHIITSKTEHPAVLETFRFLEEQGFKATYLDVDREGFVDLKQLKNSLSKETILVSIMHANNEIGTIQPIEEIAKICKEKGIAFHSDCVQSFTKVPIDVKKTPFDLLSFSSHKIYGPKGVGALFVRKGTKLQKQIHGGQHEFNKRAGTENIAGIVGFAKAAETAKQKDISRMRNLRDKLISKVLKEIPDTILNGPKGSTRLCNNANFCFKFVEGESLLSYLNLNGIAVSTGSACSSQSLEPSHVLTAIGLSHEIAHGSIRLSVGKENTAKEIDYTVACLKKNVEKLRKISPLAK